MGQNKRQMFNASEDSTRGKGDFLESIIETMHSIDGVRTERNVYLPVINDEGRKREIDILLSGQVGGYPVRIAIECKNVSSPIGVDKIDSFIGKLKDIGLPIQHGIYITSSRYTSGASKRAKKAGIQTLLYKNINEDLPESIAISIQSVIYLLLAITQIQVRNNIKDLTTLPEAMFFYDDQGKLCGSIPDLIWKDWLDGNLDETLGQHTTEVDLPESWHQYVKGQEADVKAVKVEYKISAYVLNISGDYKQHHLIDENTGKVTRFLLNSVFDVPDGKYPLTACENEDELQNALKTEAKLHLVMGRFRLPRIAFVSMYWPPSAKAIKILSKLASDSLKEGKDFDLSSIKLDKVEGSDLRAAWEPIIKDHPLFDLTQVRDS